MNYQVTISSFDIWFKAIHLDIRENIPHRKNINWRFKNFQLGGGKTLSGLYFLNHKEWEVDIC